MKILLPIDGDGDAELILDFVSKYQWPSNVEFNVLHVVGSNASENQAKEAEKQSRILLDRIADKLKSSSPSVKVTTEVRFGSAVYEIVESAVELHSQMIIMGYRTRENIKPFFTGSVANGVATVAPCSVAIIRPERDPGEVGATAVEYGLAST